MTATELCWGTVEHASITTLATVAADHGFECITVTPAMGFGLLRDARLRAEFRSILGATGLRVSCLDALMKGLPGAPEASTLKPELRQHFTHDADECLQVAVELEVPLLNVTHYLGAQVPRPALVEAIADVAARARVRGVALCLEFMTGTGIPDLAVALDIIAAVGTNVGILVDTWHFSRTGGTVEQLRAVAPGSVVCVQVNDRIAAEDRPVAGPGGPTYAKMANRLLPGDGELPLGNLVKALLANNPTVPVGIEVFSDQLRALPPQAAAARAGESLAAMLSTVDA
jgi:sugar phosphate isomerase/epimerase